MNTEICESARRRAVVTVGLIATLALVMLATYCTRASATDSGGIAVQNLMPDFWRFWRAARDRTPAAQLRLWRSLYQRPNSAVFADLRSACASDLQQSALEKHYFPVLGALIPGMRALAESLPKTIAAVEARFDEAFPDMHWKGPIYIMASGGCFNGRSQLIEGKPALLLGVDDIVGMHETNLAPLITHEMFHRYHYSHFAFEPELPQPLWVRLWAEGMATFVAHRLNPSDSIGDLTVISPGELARIEPRVGAIAGGFMNRLNSISQADAADYFSRRGKDKAVPARVGYFLGLEVAEYLASRYSMRVMAHWNHAQAKPHVMNALRRLGTARAGAVPIRY